MTEKITNGFNCVQNIPNFTRISYWSDTYLPCKTTRWNIGKIKAIYIHIWVYYYQATRMKENNLRTTGVSALNTTFHHYWHFTPLCLPSNIHGIYQACRDEIFTVSQFLTAMTKRTATLYIHNNHTYPMHPCVTPTPGQRCLCFSNFI